MNRYSSYAIACSSLVLGLGSMLLFAIFLFMGPFSIFDLRLSKTWALLIDLSLSLLFFAQHSFMIRKWARDRFSLFIPEEYYSAFYSITSGIALIAVILFWQKTPDLIVTVEGIYRWIVRALFFLSIAGFHWGTASFVSFDPFGVKKIMHHVHNKKQKPVPFTISGAYRWVRHPLYFFTLAMIWTSPEMTTDRLMFNILWTIWIFIGIMLEERDLISDFGDQYRQYQEQVPMIIPYKNPYKKRGS